MTLPLIALNGVRVFGAERAHVDEAIARGDLAAGGSFGARCESLLEAAVPGSRALLTSSCTAALEICAHLLEVGPGDEVIVPSFTFVATANAFALRGARPVFADCRADTLGLDPEHVARLITPRTKAVVAMHYAGVACDVEALVRLCEQRDIALVEDNAHGLFGNFRGRPLGSFGALATQSFHTTKAFVCGEGGALLVRDERLVSRARVLRDRGTNRPDFIARRVAVYNWVDLGSNHGLSELAAAFLLGQLEQREAILSHRSALWARYRSELAGWASARGIELPSVPPGCGHPALIFRLLLPRADQRGPFLAALAQHRIEAAFHYPPLHLSPMGRSLGGRDGDCPVAEDLSARLVRLPLHNALDDAAQGRVIEALHALELSA